MTPDHWTVRPGWPGNAWPTGKQLAEWIRALPPSEAERACSGLIDAQQQAAVLIERYGTEGR